MEVQVCIHFQLDLERGKAQQIQNRKSTKNKWKIQTNDFQWPTEVDLLYDEGKECEVKGYSGSVKRPKYDLFLNHPGGRKSG